MAWKKNWLWWLGGGAIAFTTFVLFYLYLRGTFRPEVDYQIVESPSVEDPRFPLTVVSLTNALTSYGRLTGFWTGADAIYAARNQAICSAQRSIRFETIL